MGYIIKATIVGVVFRSKTGYLKFRHSRMFCFLFLFCFVLLILLWFFLKRNIEEGREGKRNFGRERRWNGEKLERKEDVRLVASKPSEVVQQILLFFKWNSLVLGGIKC